MQYFTDLPVVLVAIHLLGAALLSAAMTWLLVSTRERRQRGLTFLQVRWSVDAGHCAVELVDYSLGSCS